MGYVHNDAVAVPISVGQMQFVTGTWADAVSGNIWTKDKTANDETATVRIPIPLPVQANEDYAGCKLESVVIYYSVGTGALDALSAAMYYSSQPADGSAPTATAVTTTYDTGHDAAAERIDIDDHTMTLTLSTPAWVDDGEVYWVELSVNAAANSVFKIGDAWANFTLRV